MLLVLKGTYKPKVGGGGVRLYNDIHWINLDRLGKVIGFADTYPLDSMMVGG